MNKDKIICVSCGRLFATEDELREHETPCRTAKMATEHGRAQLRGEGGEPQDPNEPVPSESETYQPKLNPDTGQRR